MTRNLRELKAKRVYLLSLFYQIKYTQTTDTTDKTNFFFILFLEIKIYKNKRKKK